MSIQELDNQIKECNFFKQVGITTAEELLNLREEDLEMIHEIGKRVRDDIYYRLFVL